MHLKKFATSVIQWDKGIDREMPWEGEKDPYLIWLSEILLQQTRVQQGLPYYLKFKESYPTICDLANAQEDDVFRLWQGLGYYSRCRNLIHTAKYVCSKLDGDFPSTYEEIKALKGVGPYTAAAIASFAFGEARAVVDGNVKRVLSRHFGVYAAIDSKEGIQEIQEIADKIASMPIEVARFNQAIMNFGATLCRPRKPHCSNCPLQETCVACKQNSVTILPKKDKRIKRKTRRFLYLHIETNNHVLINQRIEKDIWQNLYQFPLIETDDDSFTRDQLEKLKAFQDIEDIDIDMHRRFGPYKQILTHQTIMAHFVNISLPQTIVLVDKNYLWVKKDKLDKYAFPKVILDYRNQASNQKCLSF